EDESHSLKRIINTLLNQPVLIMTEDDGLALRGSCINFIIVDGRLKMEFNKNNMESRNLKIASELLELGKIITN
ncbi:MAG: YfiR family protein, partial [Bacteroidota bacterium]